MMYMENTAYRDVLMGSSFGYTWNRIIYDERGEATDYRYLEVNPAYERLVGLRDVITSYSIHYTKLYDA